MGNNTSQPIDYYFTDIFYTPIQENPINLLIDSVKNDNLEKFSKAIRITALRNNHLCHEEFKEKMLLFLNYKINNKNIEEFAIQNKSNKVLNEIRVQKKRYKKNNSFNFFNNKNILNNLNENKCFGRYD